MIARPSSPSVKLTAFEKPTIKKYVTTTWKTPRGIVKSLKYGISNEVEISSAAVTYKAIAATNAATDCQKSFCFAEIPAGFCKTSFL